MIQPQPQAQPQTLEAVQRWLSRTHGIAESDTRQVVEVVGAFAIATYRQQEAERGPQPPQGPSGGVTMAEVKAYVDGRIAGSLRMSDDDKKAFARELAGAFSAGIHEVHGPIEKVKAGPGLSEYLHKAMGEDRK